MRRKTKRQENIRIPKIPGYGVFFLSREGQMVDKNVIWGRKIYNFNDKRLKDNLIYARIIISNKNTYPLILKPLPINLFMRVGFL